jgi:hypothetical protein
MAFASTNPPAAPDDPFSLGIYTPTNLRLGARRALLRNSPAVVNQSIGTPFANGVVFHTPSSPLQRVQNAAVAEGTQQGNLSAPSAANQPFPIAKLAEQLAQEHTEAFNAKLAAFQAFSAALQDTAKQFTTGPAADFATQFCNGFLEYWSLALADSKSAPVPTYSSIAASNLPRQDPPQQPQPQKQAPAPRRQGQRLAPLRDDFRVFIRLEHEAPARNHTSYAIQKHISGKLGIEANRIPAITQVKTGWAIKAIDKTTQDLLVQRQADWSADLNALAIESSQKWYTYIVADCPRTLRDLQGNEVDYDNAIKHEITLQTGLTPIKAYPARRSTDSLPTQTLIVHFLEPTKRPWTLFGSSRPARYIEKSSPPYQCDTCWGYHPRRNCSRLARCRRCGSTKHKTDECNDHEKCTNCLGPHSADFTKCPARPKRDHGMLRQLTKQQRNIIRQMGAQASSARSQKQQLQQSQPQPQPQQQGPPPDQSQQQQEHTSGPIQHGPEVEASRSIHTPSPAISYIMVAGDDTETEESERDATASPKKRRRRATIASP